MNNQLYNKKSKEDLKTELENEPFNRATLSFYKYINLQNLDELRDKLYIDLNHMNVLGRIYVSREGINAQLSIPENKNDELKNYFNSYDEFKDIHIKQAIQEGDSFYKLTIKIKDEIVAYNIDSKEYDMNHVGNHLNPKEFNEAIENPDSIIVDIRNHYESEVGRFKNAIVPDVDRSQELLSEVKELLDGKENKKILLYCTGGIRCEKASSYLIKNNFKDVNQLKGGIVNYSHEVKNKKLESKFIGKNFVFDHRLGERITEDIISSCHQCNNKNDYHRNCDNDLCHLLFIQCSACDEKYDGCCSQECKDYKNLNDKDKKIKKAEFLDYNHKRLKGKVKPKLYQILN